MTPSRDIARLLEIMARLRDPQDGCPWDVKQTFETIAPYTLEEAAEVADAIARGDREDLRDELGDLLLQVVFHARMAEEEDAFDFGGVVEAITAKLIRRHPHVFGDARHMEPDAVKALWAEIKAQEKQERAARRGDSGIVRVLDGIPAALPTLTRALELQRKAGSVGFDWNDARLVLAKIREELDEVEATLDDGDDNSRREEVGDVLFAVVNLARHMGVDPDMALRQSNEKFLRRFRYIEDNLHNQNKDIAAASLDEMEALWVAAKQQEKQTAPG